MNGEGEYYIPENIENETLRYVASLVKEVLKENDILENIIQKHILAYTKTLNENCSSKSLQVMNQNHKLVFSTITPSGVIKSPRCSSSSSKKDAKAACIVNPQLRTPVKASRISSCKERKRLSFDVEENEHMKSPVKAFTEDFDGCQTRINTTSSFLENAGIAKPHDKAESIAEWFYTPDIHAIQDQIAESALNKSPYKDQTIISIINKDKTSINCNKEEEEEERKPWYLQSRPSFFNLEKVPRVFDSPDKFVEKRFNMEGKPETMTSQEIYQLDNENPKRKTQDHLEIATSPENQNSTPENYEIENKTNSRCLPFTPPFTLSEEKVFVSDKHNTNEQDSVNPDKKLETISSLSVDHLETSCISHKTPKKLQTIPVKDNKEARTSKKQIMPEKVFTIATNAKEGSSPMKDVETSNNKNIKKRKSVDEPEEAPMITSFITEDQELKVLSKISKLKHELTINNEKDISSDISVINGNDAFCSTNDSPMDVNNLLHYVDNSDMDNNGCDKTSKLNTELLTNDGKDIISADVSDMSGNDSLCSINDSPMEVSNLLHSVDNSDMDDNRYGKTSKLNTELLTNEEATMITSLVTEDQELKVTSKISQLNHEPLISDEEVTISANISIMSGNDSFCSTNDSPMNANNPCNSADNSYIDDDVYDKTSKLNTKFSTNEKDISSDVSVMNGKDSTCSIDGSPMDANSPFHSADNSAMDCNDSSNRPHGDFTEDQEIVKFSDKSIISAVRINNNYTSMSFIPDKRAEISTYQAAITQECVSFFSTNAAGNIECSSPMKDIERPNNPKMENQESVDYSKATMATSLVTEDQKFMIRSEIPKNINELTANDERVTISADNSVINGKTCSNDEPPMDVTNLFHSAMDCNDAFNRPDCDFINDQDISKSDNESIISMVHSSNNCKSIPVTPDKKSERSTYQTTETQNYVSHILPVVDNKEIAADIRNSKCDKIKTGAHETKDVESLTNLMQNLSPSEKRFSDNTLTKSMTRVSIIDHATLIEKRSTDNTFKKPMTRGSIGDNSTFIEKHSSGDIFKKPMTQGLIVHNATPIKKRSSDDTFSKSMTRRSIGDNATSIEKRSSDDIFKKPMTPRSVVDNSASTEKLRLHYNLSKTVTPPRECLISSELSIQAEKFLEYLKQREVRFSMNLHLFIEDQQDLSCICVHIERLAYVLEIQITDNQSYIISVLDFIDKARKLLFKGNSWLLQIVEDVKNWEDCIRKVNEFQQKVKQFCGETKLDRTLKDFKEMEASFRRVNKIADDMILLREIKRPSIIQFGYEVESLNQAFIQCMLAVGLLKPSSKMFSD